MRVKEALWFTTSKGTCGIVLGNENITNDPKVYIGVVKGKDEDIDTEDIISFGHKFSLNTALRIVNHLKG